MPALLVDHGIQGNGDDTHFKKERVHAVEIHGLQVAINALGV